MIWKVLPFNFSIAVPTLLFGILQLHNYCGVYTLPVLTTRNET